MPELTLTLQRRRGNVLDAALTKRVAGFVAAEERSRAMAARAATVATRANFSHKREIIPPRRGRFSTGGRMKSHLTWRSINGQVEFDTASADREAPHWIIQNIGTGKRAAVKRAHAPNPVGRPRGGATYIRTVRSQRGRRISGGLVFATGGQYSAPGSRVDEQLHWASRTRGVPRHSARTPRGQAAGLRIRNEIRGQRFVQKGGREGFREYQSSVLAAARRSFQYRGPGS